MKSRSELGWSRRQIIKAGSSILLILPLHLAAQEDPEVPPELDPTDPIDLSGGHDPISQAPVNFGAECVAKVASCCVCVKETKADSISLTLTGTDAAPVEIILEGQGPEFDRTGGGRNRQVGKVGGNQANLVCTNLGTTYTFDVYGGTVGSRHYIAVQKVGQPQTRVRCGWICILGKKSEWSLLAMEPGAPGNIPAGKKYGGAKCLSNIPAAAANQMFLISPIDPTSFVYIGKRSNIQPYPGGGQLLRHVVFLCSEIQLWCVGGAFRFIWRDRCEANAPWIKIGHCLYPQGLNRFQVRLFDCDGAMEPIKTRLFNVGVATPGKPFSFWRYDRCTGVRESYIFGGNNSDTPWRKEPKLWGGLQKTATDSSPDLNGGVTLQ